VNITLSVDEETLVRARELAANQGTSLEELVQSYIETFALAPAAESILDELKDLWRTSGGSSGGATWTREELHDHKIEVVNPVTTPSGD
jgi:hypothetical protein